MIKKRLWKEEELYKNQENENVQILNFEDFYIKTERDKDTKKIKNAYIFGYNMIDIKKFNIVELTYQKMPAEVYVKTHNINEEIYEYSKPEVYLVSILSLEALQNFKYTEKLNLLTFAFESESIALLFLNVLEDIRYNIWNNYLKDENEE